MNTTMFQAWRNEENKLWTTQEDKVSMAILKIWDVQEVKAQCLFSLILNNRKMIEFEGPVSSF